MIDVKAGDKDCRRFVMFSILYLMATALVVDTPAEILAGMRRIIISRDALITDYFVIGGYGAAFFNASLPSSHKEIRFSMVNISFVSVSISLSLGLIHSPVSSL